MTTTATHTPDMNNLLEALKVRSRCETDAMTFWLGLNPRETNIWNIDGVESHFTAFRAAVKAAKIRVTGRSIDGFTYLAPGK